jgi:light-regulated signal transduction histidine kinase (bacteriophytochrome)
MSRIRAGVDQMSQLIDGLLSLAHVSRVPLVTQTVDLSGLAAGILEHLQAEEPARAVTWRVEPGLAVFADAGLMRSVMENLLGNAWKFTSRRAGAEIEFGGSAETGEFHVSDNGAGFDMAYAQRIFGTFQRLHSVDEFPGTGIGLATVARILTRHGGRISATAQVDRGATFRFSLPVKPLAD